MNADADSTRETNMFTAITDCQSLLLSFYCLVMCTSDKLALRAGNEKDSDETADTVGCCSLRYEHVTLFEEKEGKECVVEFDFLGKDSIRYVLVG